MFKRSIKNSIETASQFFPVVLLTGPRQIGKSTLLENLASEARRYVTLDDPAALELALRDPALFIEQYAPPVIIDEIQYAPDLLRTIKFYVDKHKQAGDFWLTGSQKFHLMKGVQESLAGRVAIFDMLGFSYAEKLGQGLQSIPFLPTPAWQQEAQSLGRGALNVQELFARIWQGSYPALVANPQMPRELFYSSYLKSYLERDVKDVLQVSDSIAFHQFVRATAARTGQLLNYADLARDVGIDNKTAKAWLSVMETSGLIYLLPPYYSNVTKRIIKTPKLYFLDTGLAAYLCGWSSPETLEAGAMAGNILETYVVGEILKSYWHNGKGAPLYFYRDTHQQEIALLIEQDGKLYPIEIKKNATPSNLRINFSPLKRLDKEVGEGAVLCLRPEPIALSREITSLPIWWV